MTNLQLEGRLRQAAVNYGRMAPAAPRLESRILAQVAVTPRPPSQSRFGGRSLALQLGATIALVAFAVGVGFLIRESRLHQQPQPGATPTVTTSPPSTSGGGGSFKYSVFGMGMWHPGGMMVTPAIGWSAGGLLSRTSDGGAHWTNVTPSALRNDYMDLQSEYLDATHAWIIQDVPGRPLLVFRTTDGGKTWERSTALNYTAGNSVQLDFADATHGWILTPGSNGDATGPSLLYQTADGGLHWQLAATGSGQTTGKPGIFGCARWCMMSFASAKVGVITSLSSVVDDRAMSILVTHDGGVSWQRQRLPLTASKTQCPCYVDRPVFLGSTHGFLVVWSAAGPVGAPLIGHLLVTSDGGGSWSPRTLPAEAQIDIGFSDPLHGWAIAGSVTDLGSLELAAGPDLSLPLYRTNDGGITWVRVPNDLQIRSKSGEIRRINFLDQNVGFLFNFPRVLKSVDGGRTWTAGGTFPPLPPPNQGG